MEKNSVKLNPKVFIYTINERIFLRSEENIYEFQEVNDIKKTLFFVRELTKGIDIDEFIKDMEVKDKNDFSSLYDFLKEKKFLVKKESHIDDKFVCFSNHFSNIDILNDNVEKLKNINIKIICENEKLKQLLKRNLQDNGFSGLSSLDNDKEVKLAIFIKNYKTSEKEIERINVENFKNKITWLLVDFSIGNYISIGPLIIPNKTACYKCFLERRMINDDTITTHSLFLKKIIKEGKINYLPLHYNFTASIITDNVLRFCLELTVLTQNYIIYADLQKFEIWKEYLLKYPKCPVCGLTK